MNDTEGFEAEKTREFLMKRGISAGSFVRYQYRPFDVRWLYWEPDTKLLDRNRADYFPQVRPGNLWLGTNQRNRKSDFYVPLSTALLSDYHIFESNASMFPLLLYPEVQRTILDDGTDLPRPNLTEMASEYLKRIRSSPSELFHHVIAVVHAGAYTEEEWWSATAGLAPHSPS